VRVTDLSGQDGTVTSGNGAEASVSSAGGGGLGSVQAPDVDDQHDYDESSGSEQDGGDEEFAAMGENDRPTSQGAASHDNSNGDSDDDVVYLGMTVPTSQRNSPHVSVSDEAPDEGAVRSGGETGAPSGRQNTDGSGRSSSSSSSSGSGSSSSDTENEESDRGEPDHVSTRYRWVK
jgi:hypothetical protein